MFEIKKLAKHSLVYSMASILTQSITLFMVPIFTKNMDQQEFGQYNLLISVQSLLAILITIGATSGMTRFINEFEDKNKTKNNVLTFLMLWGLLAYLLSIFCGDLLYRVVFFQKEGGIYIIFLVASSVLLSLISVYITYYTMLFKPKHVSVINVSRTVFMLLFSAYFVMIRKDGVYGALQAQLYAYTLVLIGLLIYDLKNIRFVFAWDELKVILKYGIGLLPGNASSWIYTLIDRYFINAMMGLQQVAIYSMGYKIGMLMEPILLAPFISVFTSFKYKVYKETGFLEKYKKIYLYYNFIGWLCILFICVFAKPAIIILSTKEYVEAFKVVPFIALSYFIYGLGEFYSLGIHIKNNSLLSSLILTLGAGSNILLNIGLIPRLGIMGAAVATVCSYIIMNIMFFWIGKRYLDLGLRYFEPVKGGILVLGLLILYFATYSMFGNLFIEILFSSLLCIMFLLGGFFGGMVPRDATKVVFLQISRIVGMAKFSQKS